MNVIDRMENYLMARLRVCYVVNILIVGLLSACASDPAKPPTLFERMGGMPVLTAVADETVDIASQDPRTMRSFEGIKLKALKESIAKHLCEVSGGKDCQYEGETMKNAHHDANITQAEFEAFVTIFREVLDKHMATREKNELLRILAPMKRDIVYGGVDSNKP